MDIEQAEIVVRFLAETLDLLKGKFSLRIKRKLALQKELESSSDCAK